MRILVVLPATKEAYNDEDIESRIRNAESRVSTGTRIEIAFPEKVSLHVDWPGEKEWAAVAPYVVNEFRKAEEMGFDAATVHCVEDPGVAEAKKLCRMPIVGFGWATYHVAAMLTDRIGIVSPSSSLTSLITNQVKSYGFEDKVVSIGHVEMPLTQMRRQRNQLARRLVEESRKLVSQGAQVIVPACDVMIPETVQAEVVQSAIGVPVLDPELIGLRMAETVVKAGLSHSLKD